MGMFDIDEEEEVKTDKDKKQPTKDKSDSTKTTIVFYVCVTIIILAAILVGYLSDMKQIELEEQKLVYNSTIDNTNVE